MASLQKIINRFDPLPENSTWSCSRRKILFFKDWSTNYEGDVNKLLIFLGKHKANPGFIIQSHTFEEIRLTGFSRPRKSSYLINASKNCKSEGVCQEAHAHLI